MKRLNKVHTLTAFKPFFWLLKAYDSKKFANKDWLCLVKNIGFALGVTVLIALLPTSIVLTIWCLIERNDVLRNVVVAAPLLFTLLQMFIKILVLVNKHGKVNETLGNLQRVIDQRMCTTFFSYEFSMSNVEGGISFIFREKKQFFSSQNRLRRLGQIAPILQSCRK